MKKKLLPMKKLKLRSRKGSGKRERVFAQVTKPELAAISKLAKAAGGNLSVIVRGLLRKSLLELNGSPTAEEKFRIMELGIYDGD